MRKSVEERERVEKNEKECRRMGKKKEE